jgi:hypothetical protein
MPSLIFYYFFERQNLTMYSSGWPWSPDPPTSVIQVLKLFKSGKFLATWHYLILQKINFNCHHAEDSYTDLEDGPSLTTKQHSRVLIQHNSCQAPGPEPHYCNVQRTATHPYLSWLAGFTQHCSVFFQFLSSAPPTSFIPSFYILYVTGPGCPAVASVVTHSCHPRKLLAQGFSTSAILATWATCFPDIEGVLNWKERG